ncbi:MAG TPA: arsenical-resistance protein, partial [Nodosilinea sp.]|nr:arsenical-resistance protein [Nodosilinea sp.]
MTTTPPPATPRAATAGGQLSFFERYLTLWVGLCIGAGIALGRLFPGVAVALDAMSIYQVSVPIAICLFFMMYPIMVKIDFSQARRAAQSPKPVILTLVVNWLIKPFTMVLFAQAFLGGLFRPLIVSSELVRGSEIALADSYIAGTILLGIAPCTAMVLMWGFLSFSNQGLTL